MDFGGLWWTLVDFGGLWRTLVDFGVLELFVLFSVHVNHDSAALQGRLCAVQCCPQPPAGRRPAWRVAGGAWLSVPCLA